MDKEQLRAEVRGQGAIDPDTGRDVVAGLFTVSRIVKGRADLLVVDGKIDWQAMRRHGIGERDLYEAMREQGVAELEGVRAARLERDGNITVES